MALKLIAPPHTPFDSNGHLNLDVVPQQAAHLRSVGVSAAFVCGSTGEGQSMTVAERMRLAEAWVAACQNSSLEVIVQVGHNCQPDAIALASHAADIGANAVSSLAPCYFKPTSVDDLIDFFAPIAGAASGLPFFFYDIPVLTGVSLSTVAFLQRGRERLPNLAGVKYTNNDMIQFQECIRFADGQFEIWFGCDEALLAGYALGARGAVGSTYNFAAPLYHRMIAAYDEGDERTARDLQAKSVALIRVCQSFGYSAAAKFVMSLVGIDCGSVRSPLRNLTDDEMKELRRKLERLNVLDFTSHSAAS